MLCLQFRHLSYLSHCVKFVFQAILSLHAGTCVCVCCRYGWQPDDGFHAICHPSPLSTSYAQQLPPCCPRHGFFWSSPPPLCLTVSALFLTGRKVMTHRDLSAEKMSPVPPAAGMQQDGINVARRFSVEMLLDIESMAWLLLLLLCFVSHFVSSFLPA